ncbi:MAG TPA: D-2-hydroxyacid dehydrogenase [Gemmatimonadaceae bacterium]|nr:D-2-hydroxyacid dehydrogenase [Gemmatimonadaceae bacterium]
MTPTRRLVLDLAAAAPQWAIPPQTIDAISRAAPADWLVDVVDAPTSSESDGGAAPSDQVLRAIADAEVYVGYGMSPPLFAAANRLRWIHSASAGVRSLLFDELARSDVLVTNSAGIYAIPIAEHVVAGVMALTRGLDLAVAQQRERRWEKRTFDGPDSPVREVSELRVLIVGAGGIGGAVAERFAALGARCTGLRRRPELGTPPGCDAVAGPDALDELLPGHNVLVLAAPATPRTRELVTAERLDRLPEATIVVNVARGALLDERALAARLAAGRLRGAVLDVFEREPLSPDSPLWTIPSAILTPHVAGVSPRRFWPRQAALLLENWDRYVRGEPLRNTVDKAAGY